MPELSPHARSRRAPAGFIGYRIYAYLSRIRHSRRPWLMLFASRRLAALRSAILNASRSSALAASDAI